MSIESLKVMVRSGYDLQKIRIQMGGRLSSNFLSKLGKDPNQKIEEMDKGKQKVIKDLKKRFNKITDGIVKFNKEFKFISDGIIENRTELILIHEYIEIEKKEREHFKNLEKILEDYEIYTTFLKDINGIGPAMSGVIISEINIKRSKYVSSIWKYAGLDVCKDGKGRSNHKEHLVESKYKDKKGKIKTKMGISYNPFLKTKLIGVLAGCLIKSGKSKYVKIYNDYKNRLKNHQIYKTESDGHRNNMAKRYMIKIFLLDLYTSWRKLEGLKVSLPYHEDKLGYQKHNEEIYYKKAVGE